MTTAQVVETSITVNNNSPIQDYVHPDDQTQPTFEMTPGFKRFTAIVVQCFPVCNCSLCKEVQCLSIQKNNLRMLLELDFSITKIFRLHVNYYQE